MTDHVSYRHVQPFTALWLILPISAIASLLGFLAAPRTAIEQGLGLAVALALPVTLLLLLGRLVIELRGPRLHWHFGFLGWPRWSVALDDIERIERTRSRALHGAGIKGLGGKAPLQRQPGRAGVAVVDARWPHRPARHARTRAPAQLPRRASNATRRGDATMSRNADALTRT